MSKSLGSIRNLTPFSGGTPTSHIRPQLPIVQHTFPPLFQTGHHVSHLHASYTSQLEGLYFPESFFKLYDSRLDAISLLCEDSEAVDFHYYRLVTEISRTSVDGGVVSMLGCKDVQVLLGVYRVTCEGEEWGGI